MGQYTKKIKKTVLKICSYCKKEYKCSTYYRKDLKTYNKFISKIKKNKGFYNGKNNHK